MIINLNITQLAFRPKKEESRRVEEFRPISPCNVVMKIIMKVLANRLSEYLPLVISPNQSAFFEKLAHYR